MLQFGRTNDSLKHAALGVRQQWPQRLNHDFMKVKKKTFNNQYVSPIEFHSLILDNSKVSYVYGHFSIYLVFRTSYLFIMDGIPLFAEIGKKLFRMFLHFIYRS